LAAIQNVRTAPVLEQSRPASRLGRYGDERVLAWLALAAITLAEIVTTYVDPIWGVSLHSVLLGMFITWAALGRDRWSRALALSLALAPLIRMLSLGMPLGDYPQTAWYVLSAAPMFVGAIAVARLAELSPAEIGLRLPARRDLPIEGAVIATGLILGVLEYAILRPDPLAEGSGFLGIAVAAVVLLIGTGVMEEFVFRGVLQRTASQFFSKTTAIAFVSLLFGALHIGHQSVVDVVFVTLVAVYFALVVARTRSLLGVSIAHGLTNILLFIALPRLWG
jgi:membrane protease YdiL (CAAX protease family)